jgi:LPS sulfotransferase NodH
VVAQAVSWARASQTHFWHPGEAVQPGGSEPHYDGELIGRLVTTIEQFEQRWRRWFADHAIEPFEVVYENLAADPQRIARQVLDHLGLQLPSGRQLASGHRRQADQINADWAVRFRAR